MQSRLNAYDMMLQGIAGRPHSASGPPIYVAATGNDSSTSSFDFPAYQDEMVAVGAVDSSGARSSFTNYGSTGHAWHFMAPGGEETPPGTITEDVGTGGSGGQCFGTSVAAAYATGMLALLRSETRYASKARKDFLAAVARDHCDLPTSASTLEYGSGQIVYDNPGAAGKQPSAATSASEASKQGARQQPVNVLLNIEVGDDYVRIGDVRIPRRTLT